MDKAHVTLHQHLGDTRCTAKVTIYLEWGVRIPEIVQCTILQQIAIKLVGMVAIVQTSPLVQLPTHRPSRGTIATMLQYHLGSLRQHRSGDRRNGAARMQTEEMVHMAMLILRIIYILRPLHQLTIAANLIRSNVLQGIFPLLAILGILAQNLARLYGIEQNLTNHGMSEGGTLVYRSVLRRCGRSRCIDAILAMPQIICCEISTSLDDIVCCLAQELLIAGIVVIIPEMGSQPWTGKWREVPRHILACQRRSETEDVAGYRCGPATGTII